MSHILSEFSIIKGNKLLHEHAQKSRMVQQTTSSLIMSLILSKFSTIKGNKLFHEYAQESHMVQQTSD